MKILCVEDDVDIATLMDNVLSASGHYATVCHNGVEAVSLCKSEGFNLIFLDLGIPELSGREVIEKLEKDGFLNDQKIVILTANDLTNEEIQYFNEKGITEILQKPISLEKILESVKKYE